MCGIVGAITRDPINPQRWAEACLIQAHRGPDGSGEWFGTIGEWSLGLAHQRLAILDLSPKGAQPMIHPRTGSVLVLNGEIYNFVELREELESDGLHFEGHSDTEVLLHALEHWGIDETLPRLNGMWAFAWLDIRNRRLYLSRDRCGEKPLYLAVRGESLFFSSELKTILTLLGTRQCLNIQSVGEFLSYSLLDMTSGTMISGVDQVEAGTFTSVSLERPDLTPISKPYWTCPVTSRVAVPWNEFVEALRDKFLQSVRIRLRSDVPVGILLSGGLDSSSIAGAAKAIGSGNLQILAAVDDDSRYDESPFIDTMARFIGWPVTKIRLPQHAETLFQHIEEATWYMDGPIGSLSNISHYLLMKAAKEQGVTVVLSGQGGDELLCGYRKYLGFYLQWLVRGGHIGKAMATLGAFWRNRTIVNQFNWSDAKRYLPKSLRGNNNSILGEGMSSFRLANIGLRRDDTVNDRQLLDLTKYSVPSINHSEDRMSMAWSREIRLPFLDPHIIEMLIAAPASYKLQMGWTKYAMRCAMEPLLPAAITWRKDKQGFSNPEGEWIKRELKGQIMDGYLHPDALIFRMGIINRKALLARYERYCTQKPQQGRIYFGEIFTPIALEVWLRQFRSFGSSQESVHGLG